MEALSGCIIGASPREFAQQCHGAGVRLEGGFEVSDYVGLDVGSAMRGLALIFVLMCAPAVAADYSPWLGRDVLALEELAQAPNGGACCKHCTKGQPCGNTCISAKAKCKSPPGCAC